MRRLSLLAFALLVATGCETLGEGSPTDSGLDTGDTLTGPTGPTGPTTPTGTVTEQEDWTRSFHPCVGYRTDTLWVDSRDDLWVGCGSTTVGYGLFRSTDGGRTWSAPTTSPARTFEDFRVSSISRSADGLLYVAGIDTAGSRRVVSMDDSGAVSDVFVAGGQIWNNFHVGTFRRAADGLAVAESLTGTGVVARFGDAAPFEDGEGWWVGGESSQILDLTLHDEQFYGVGSTISQPPMVFLPPRGGQDPARGFWMEVLTMSNTFTGELWGLDVDAGGVVAAGVDQDADRGVVFVSGPDPYALASWRMLDVRDVVGASSGPTWMRGACRRGDVVVAVGEYSQRDAGIVLRSDDGGDTWADVTPSALFRDLPALQRCEVLAGGDLVIAGGDGTVLVYDPR